MDSRVKSSPLVFYYIILDSAVSVFLCQDCFFLIFTAFKRKSSRFLHGSTNARTGQVRNPHEEDDEGVSTFHCRRRGHRRIRPDSPLAPELHCRRPFSGILCRSRNFLEDEAPAAAPSVPRNLCSASQHNAVQHTPPIMIGSSLIFIG